MRIGRTLLAAFTVAIGLLCAPLHAQINTDRMMQVGRTALYFDDYVLSIQYFNQVISAKPYLYEPYFYRAVAKLSLEDYRGAERDCNSSIEPNPFVVNSYQVVYIRSGMTRLRLISGQDLNWTLRTVRCVIT